ncbi:Hypothetical predicted protein, partial [Pelobates cultripes]
HAGDFGRLHVQIYDAGSDACYGRDVDFICHKQSLRSSLHAQQSAQQTAMLTAPMPAPVTQGHKAMAKSKHSSKTSLTVFLLSQMARKYNCAKEPLAGQSRLNYGSGRKPSLICLNLISATLRKK